MGIHVTPYICAFVPIKARSGIKHAHRVDSTSSLLRLWEPHGPYSVIPPKISPQVLKQHIVVLCIPLPQRRLGFLAFGVSGSDCLALAPRIARCLSIDCELVEIMRRQPREFCHVSRDRLRCGKQLGRAHYLHLLTRRQRKQPARPFARGARKCWKGIGGAN